MSLTKPLFILQMNALIEVHILWGLLNNLIFFLEWISVTNGLAQYWKYLGKTWSCKMECSTWTGLSSDLTPAVNFINVILTHFSYERRFGSFYYLHVTRKKLPKQCWHEKFVRIMLMKVTPDRISSSFLLLWL